MHLYIGLMVACDLVLLTTGMDQTRAGKVNKSIH